jgi:hypothetical protein
LCFSSKERNENEVFHPKKKNCGFSCKEGNVVVVSHPKKENVFMTIVFSSALSLRFWGSARS